MAPASIHKLSSEKKKKKNGDQLIRGFFYNKQLRASAVVATETIKEICDLHQLNPIQTVLMGRSLVAVALLGSTSKKKGESITMMVQGDGALKQIIAEYVHPGYLRGFCSSFEATPEEIAKYTRMGEALGDGTISIKKMISDSHKPYVGVSKLVSGEIGEDIAEYLLASEQVESTVSVGVDIDPKTGSVIRAGGVLVQKMGGVELAEETLDQINMIIAGGGGILSKLADGMSCSDIFTTLTHPEVEVADIPDRESLSVSGFCSCSRKRFFEAMKSIGYDELKATYDDVGKLEALCHYCTKNYLFDPEEFKS